MGQQPEPDDSRDEADGQWVPLSRAERVSAGAVGGVASIAGLVALFVTDNQIGTGAVLVIAVAFLLIAVQGTPLTRFGSGDHAFNLERRRLGSKLRDQAKDEHDDEAREALLVAAATVDPPVGYWDPAAPIRYESAVQEALTRVLGQDKTLEIARPARDMGVDYLVRISARARVGVETVFTRRALTPSRFMDVQGYAAFSGTPVLLVTNAPLSSQVQNLNAKSASRQLDDTFPPVEAVTWSGPADDNALHRAFLRLARSDN